MDRVLEVPQKRPSSPKEELRLLFPGEKDWENWILRSGKPPELKSSLSQSDLGQKLKTSGPLAIPLQYLMVIPIWLATTDKGLMKDMLGLQLESRGLGKTADSYSFDHILIREEKDRSLLSVSVLTDNFPSDLCFSRITDYRPAADYWTLPSNHLLLWKELGKLILAFTSGPDLVYVQSTSSDILLESLVYEAHSARLVLESDGTLPLLQGVAVLGSFSRQEIKILEVLNLPIQQMDRPIPTKPKGSRKLLPGAVYHSQQERTKARSKRNFLLIAAAVYVLIVGAIVGQLATLVWQRSNLDQEASTHRSEVETLRRTSERWQAMELALLPETYPVEMLLRCTQVLPEEGVRFTNFDQDQNRILIAGEAKNALAALQYIESLKKNPGLDAYEWEMPPPALLPNDSAQFRIEGKRRDANPQIH